MLRTIQDVKLNLQHQCTTCTSYMCTCTKFDCTLHEGAGLTITGNALHTLAITSFATLLI